VAKPQQPQGLLDARGRTLIERRGVSRSSLKNDVYHFLRTATWTRILSLFAVLYMTANTLFALVLWVGRGNVSNEHSFLDYLWFSVQTMATIGYGYLTPMDTFANVVITIESFVGILMAALITGLVFARFSTPSARVLFSKIALVTEHDGKRVLMFRLANERATAIVEATVRAYLTREERLANGEPFRRVYDLPLRRNTSPVFALSFLVVHELDDKSPLHGATPASITADATNVVVTFTGIDDQLAQTVHARYLWSPGDFQFDRRYADLFKIDEHGKRYLDLTHFHETEPLSPASRADPA
jgi:inward rectifier potassium channel